MENEIVLFLDKEKTSSSTQHESTKLYIKLILEDIRRTAEHASDIAEGAMNETVSETIEKVPSSETRVVTQCIHRRFYITSNSSHYLAYK